MAPATQPSTSSGTKRKRPPTFQHLPANRAKKLKKSWIETKKLKAKWKAEKRREGLLTNSALLTGHRHDDDDDDNHNDEDDDGHGTTTDDRMFPQDGQNPSSEDEDAAWISSMAQGKEGHSYNLDEDGDSATETRSHSRVPSRERPPHLKKLAQSRTMVPNKKTRANKTTDPLNATPHRQHKPKHNNGEQIQNNKNPSSRAGVPRTRPQPSEQRQKDDAGFGRGRRPRGGGQGRGSRGGKGQQPDMKLRMGTLLEKIKRDYT